jgi:auxin efflux carrier family protein
MGVFGNSNSLPISLVLSLSQTLKGLHWDKIPGDNDDEVGARGILYLLIFQQLGQLVRWSWGYHVLLAPKDKYPEYQNEIVEEGLYREDGESRPLLRGYEEDDEDNIQSLESDDSETYEPAGRTPVAGTSRASPADSEDEDDDDSIRKTLPKPKKNLFSGQHQILNGSQDDILSFPRISGSEEPEIPAGIKGYWVRARLAIQSHIKQLISALRRSGQKFYHALPSPLQSVLLFVRLTATKTYNFLWEFMNPPLWAMLFAVIVASVPRLQTLFFEDGSFINNSVTSAVRSSGGVAVPLILVVLGANLARNTQKRDGTYDPEEEQIGKKLLVASLISRMLLPTLIMGPLLAIIAKYVPVSILDDPIFIIVCFLLTGAPSALQLAQICQINGVYENVMSRILFQSYVVWYVRHLTKEVSIDLCSS